MSNLLFLQRAARKYPEIYRRHSLLSRHRNLQTVPLDYSGWLQFVPNEENHLMIPNPDDFPLLNTITARVDTIRGTKEQKPMTTIHLNSYQQDNYLAIYASLLKYIDLSENTQENIAKEVVSEIKRLLAGVWKIHLMPTTEHYEEVVERLFELIAGDEINLWGFKFDVGPLDELYQERIDAYQEGKEVIPLIVLYCQYGRRSVCETLYRLMQQFPEEEEDLGLGISPRYNRTLSSLIYYRSGHGDHPLHNIMNTDLSYIIGYDVEVPSSLTICESYRNEGILSPRHN